jgi:AcrR family transcriptional regulator
VLTHYYGAVTVTRRATALPPEERRQAIVEATLPLLMAHGTAVTTRQIAECAGIAEGTIFRVFADKDEIIVAVVEEALDTAPLEAALEQLAPELSFEDALAGAVVVLQQRTIDTWRLISSVGTRFHELTRRPLVDSSALVRLFACHADRISVEPIVAARLLRALTLSTTHPMMAGEPHEPRELVHLFLHGVARGGDPC